MIIGKLWHAIKAQINKIANIFWTADPIAQMQYEYDMAVNQLKEGREGLERFPEFHLGAAALCPPMIGIDAVAHENGGEALWKCSGGIGARGRFTPNWHRFQPRQGHGHAHSSQKSPAG